MKFTLISYMILMIFAIFAMNKLVGSGNMLQEKVLGQYAAQMEEINKVSGMNVYNLDKENYTDEELEILNQIY